MSSLQNPLKQRAGVEARPLPQGALLVDMNSGHCFRLNRVGAEIWTMLHTPLSVDEVCARIAARFRKPVDQIDIEVRALVVQLINEELLDSPIETAHRLP
jgi:hypothetical protein